jgi:uncharacterized protein (TIGR04255 family)
MTDYPKLSKPPIIEALVDIQVQPVVGLSVDGIRTKLPSSVSSQYPKSEEIKKFESSFIQGPSGAQVCSKDLGAYGLMFRNQTNTRAVQIRVDGFALSHLQPYSNFESLQEEAQPLWLDYKKMIGSATKVLRVAIRYINVIECNRTLTSWNELNDFLKNIPSPPKGAASEPTGFGIEIVSHDAANSIATTVRRGLLKNLQTQQHGISVDIEVVKQFSHSPDEEQLWSSIKALRPIKNDVFFDVIAEGKIKEYL